MDAVVSVDMQRRGPSNALRDRSAGIDAVEALVARHLPVRNRLMSRLRRRMAQAVLGRVVFVRGIFRTKSRDGCRQRGSVGLVGWGSMVVETLAGEEVGAIALGRPAVPVRPSRRLNNGVAVPCPQLRRGAAAQSDSPNVQRRVAGVSYSRASGVPSRACRVRPNGDWPVQFRDVMRGPTIHRRVVVLVSEPWKQIAEFCPRIRPTPLASRILNAGDPPSSASSGAVKERRTLRAQKTRSKSVGPRYGYCNAKGGWERKWRERVEVSNLEEKRKQPGLLVQGWAAYCDACPNYLPARMCPNPQQACRMRRQVGQPPWS